MQSGARGLCKVQIYEMQAMANAIQMDMSWTILYICIRRAP